MAKKVNRLKGRASVVRKEPGRFTVKNQNREIVKLELKQVMDQEKHNNLIKLSMMKGLHMSQTIKL